MLQVLQNKPGQNATLAHATLISKKTQHEYCVEGLSFHIVNPPTDDDVYNYLKC